MDMKKIWIVLMLLFLVTLAAGVFAQPTEGLWEFTTQLEMTGMTQQMPPAALKQCITKSDPLVKNQDKSYNCRTTGLNISGGTVTYSMECKGKDGTVTYIGKNIYTETTMEGTATVLSRMKGQPGKMMKSKITGKYLDVCPQ